MNKYSGCAYALFIFLNFTFFQIRSAALKKQSIIIGTARVAKEKALLASEGTKAFYDLVQHITSLSSENSIFLGKTLLIAQTGMPVEEDPVLIPLDIEFESHDKSLSMPHYWPYAWFVDAVNGNRVKIRSRAYRLLLLLAPQEGADTLFHIDAAGAVFACLKKSSQQLGDRKNFCAFDCILERYGIEIDDLKEDKRKVRG